MTGYDEEKTRKKSERHHLRKKIDRYVNEYDASENIETTNRLKFKVEVERIRALSMIALALERMNRREEMREDK